MLPRLLSFAGSLALSVFASTQAFGLTLSGIPVPTLPRLCVLKVYYFGTGGFTVQSYPRVCEGNEKTGAVKSLYQPMAF